MKHQYWPAIILILIGFLLLLYQTDLLDFAPVDLFSYGFIFIGIIFLVKGLNRDDKKGILGGVFFTTFGVGMFLMREYILPRDEEFALAAFFLALALGNFAVLYFKKHKSTNIIWGIVFGLLGGLVLWAYYGYYPSWYIYDQMAMYWPVILIVFGAVIIIKGYVRNRNIEEAGVGSQS